MLNKLLTGTLNASINPFATEFIGTPFHNTNVCELDVPLNVGLIKHHIFLNKLLNYALLSQKEFEI